MTGVVLATTFFDSNEDFVGEIVSKWLSVLRHKYCKGDYGDEKQVIKDSVKTMDKFPLSEIQAKREIC